MTIPPCPFKTGDEVRLRTGNSTIVVLEVDYFHCSTEHNGPPHYAKRKYSRRPRKGWYIRFSYKSSLSHEHEGRKWREAEDFVLINQKETEMTKVLYQTIVKEGETPRFGTFLTKTQNGKIVLEMKGGSGDVESFSPEQIEKVVPYTVELTRMHGGENPGETRHFEVNKGDVEIGDIMLHLSNGNVWEVTALDTKREHPSASKNGFLKLDGIRIGQDK